MSRLAHEQPTGFQTAADRALPRDRELAVRAIVREAVLLIVGSASAAAWDEHCAARLAARDAREDATNRVRSVQIDEMEAASKRGVPWSEAVRAVGLG